jgi:hypothetical protein
MEETAEKKQYIGQHEVFGLVQDELKTPLGSEVVKVIFKEGKEPILMTKKGFDALVTEKPIDATSLMEMKMNILIPEIVKVVAEWDIKIGELHQLSNRLIGNIADNFDRASSFLWHRNDKEWIKGFNPAMERSLLDAEKVLKSIPIDEPGKS